MPRYPGIEQYQRRVQTPGPILPNLTPQPSIGSGLADLGAGLRDLGNAEYEVREQKAAVAANSELMASRAHWLTQLAERKKTAQPGADGFTPAILEDFDKDAEDRLKRAQTGRARRELEQRLSAVRIGLQEDAMAYEAAEGVRYRSEQLTTSADQAANAARVSPYDFPEIAAAQKSAIENSGLDPAARADLWKSAKSKLSVAAVMAMVENDPRGTSSELAKEDSQILAIQGLTNEQRVKLIEYAKEKALDSEASTLGAIYQRDIRAGDAAVAEFRKRADLTDDEKNGVLADVQQKIVENRNTQKRAYVNEMTALESQIATDNVTAGTYQEAARLYRLGVFSPDEYSGLVSRAADAQSRSAKKNAVLGVLDEGWPLSAHNSDHVKALGQAFDAATKGEPVGSDFWKTVGVSMSKRYRMMPERVNDWLNQASKAIDVEMAGAGAEFYGALKADAPDALRTVHPDTKAVLEIMDDMMKNGASAQVAMETARKNVIEITPQVRDAREKEYFKVDKGFRDNNGSALNSFVDQDFDSAFQWQPGVGDILRPEFDAQVGKYYVKTGDIEKARELAWSDLKKIYGVTTVNGEKVMMPLPPENFGVEPEEVRKEIADAVAQFPPKDGSTAEEITVVPTAASLRMMGNIQNGELLPPSYYLLDKSGNRLLGPQGKPLVYELPNGQELVERLRAAEMAANQKAIGDARRARDAQKEMNDLIQSIPPPGY